MLFSFKSKGNKSSYAEFKATLLGDTYKDIYTLSRNLTGTTFGGKYIFSLFIYRVQHIDFKWGNESLNILTGKL